MYSAKSSMEILAFSALAKVDLEKLYEYSWSCRGDAVACRAEPDLCFCKLGGVATCTLLSGVGDTLRDIRRCCCRCCLRLPPTGRLCDGTSCKPGPTAETARRVCGILLVLNRVVVAPFRRLSLRFNAILTICK